MPSASFRFQLALDTLALGYTLPAIGRVTDLHRLENVRAGRTRGKSDAFCPTLLFPLRLKTFKQRIMNKVTTSFWDKLFFKRNIRKIRKALLNYLSEEGIEYQMVDGGIRMIWKESVYVIHFDMNYEYPLCEISYHVGDDDYQALEVPQKTFIADKVNTDKARLSTVKAFNDEICISTSFYFTSKKMLLVLFFNHFTDLRATVDATMEQAIDAIQEKENKRPIGFVANQMSQSEKEATQIAASDT